MTRDLVTPLNVGVSGGFLRFSCSLPQAERLKAQSPCQLVRISGGLAMLSLGKKCDRGVALHAGRNHLVCTFGGEPWGNKWWRTNGGVQGGKQKYTPNHLVGVQRKLRRPSILAFHGFD